MRSCVLYTLKILCEIAKNKDGEQTMGKMLGKIQAYWTNRAEGYSQTNREELAGAQKEKWLAVLKEGFPKREPSEIKVLDMGTGPGFFAIILARAGYQVTAVDCTEEMLCKARENAGDYAGRINWRQMDVQRLEFADESFDVVVSRNLTWDLEEPDRAYAEWMRVLKTDGILLNFDANWYAHLFDAGKRREYEADRRRAEAHGVEDHYVCTDVAAMEEIARQIPLSPVKRPEWDIRTLKQIGARSIRTDCKIWSRVWSEVEKINYASTPMFMVRAVK